MQKVSALLRPANWSLAPARRGHRQPLLRDRGRRRRGPAPHRADRGGRGHRRHRVPDREAAPGGRRAERAGLLAPLRRASPSSGPARCSPSRSSSAARALGVIELVNGEGDPRFGEEDLAAVMAIADFAAIAIQNARDFQRVQELTLVDEHTGLGQRPLPPEAARRRDDPRAEPRPPAVAPVPRPRPLQDGERLPTGTWWGARCSARWGGCSARSCGRWTPPSATGATSSR